MLFRVLVNSKSIKHIAIRNKKVVVLEQAISEVYAHSECWQLQNELTCMIVALRPSSFVVLEHIHSQTNCFIVYFIPIVVNEVEVLDGHLCGILVDKFTNQYRIGHVLWTAVWSAVYSSLPIDDSEDNHS